MLTDRLPGDVSRLAEYSFLKKHLDDSTPKFVVDVGAYGKKNSNSWNLIKDGWKGLLIEPRPEGAKACREQFEGDFAVEQLAISNFNGISRLRMYKVAGWASLLPTHKRTPRIAHRGKKEERPSIEVGVTMLPVLLEKHAIPERFGVLSVDVEGVDQTVIEPMFETKWRPDFIIIEDCAPEPLRAEGYRRLAAMNAQAIWARSTT